MRKYLSTVSGMYREPKWFFGALFITIITAVLSAAEEEARDEEKRETLHGARILISAIWYVVYFRAVIHRMKAKS